MAELRVNFNSYVTIEEVDAYVDEHYLSTSAEAITWGKTSEEDKVRALIASAKALNNLRYKGQKRVKGQKLAFPRKYSTFPGITYVPYVSQYSDSSLFEGVGGKGDGGLASAKEAQIVNALAMLAVDADLVADIRERTVAAVRSESIGKASTSYDIDSPRTKNIMRGIYDYDRVTYILSAWLTDSVFSL